MLDVESGEVLLRGQLAAGAVACMSWAEEAAAAGGGAQPDGDGLLPHGGAARFCGAPAAPVPPPGRMAPQVRASIAEIQSRSAVCPCLTSACRVWQLPSAAGAHGCLASLRLPGLDEAPVMNKCGYIKAKRSVAWVQVYDCCRQPVEDGALAWSELPPRLSLLCAADCRGRVSVFASSLFPLAEVDVGALATDARGADGGVHVLQVDACLRLICSCCHLVH